MKKKIASAILFLFLCVIVAVFGVLCLFYYQSGFIGKNRVLLSVLAVSFVLLYAIAGTFLLCKSEEKPLYETLSKTLLSGAILASVLIVLFFVLQRTGFLELVADSKRFEEYLQTSGRWMPFVYVLLQYLQVVILPIPSFVSTLAGVALFGPFLTCVYSLIGILLGSFTAFFIGRKLGSKAVAWMIGKDTLEKWQERLKGKDNLLLTMMFVLPVFPDDVLCFVAGLSSMSNVYFSIMIVISRILSVGTTCYSVDLIPLSEPWGVAVWCAISVVVLAVFILLYRNIDKINDFLQKKKGKNKQK